MDRHVESYSFLVGITDFSLKSHIHTYSLPGSCLVFTTGEEIVHHGSRSSAAPILNHQSILFAVPFYIYWDNIFKNTEVVKIPWLFNYF